MLLHFAPPIILPVDTPATYVLREVIGNPNLLYLNDSALRGFSVMSEQCSPRLPWVELLGYGLEAAEGLFVCLDRDWAKKPHAALPGSGTSFIATGGVGSNRPGTGIGQF